MSYPTRLLFSLVTTLGLVLFWVGSAEARQSQQQQQQQTPPDTIQELIKEYQELQQRVDSLEVKALEQNEDLQDQREELVVAIDDAISTQFPDLDDKVERLEEIQAEYVAAQEAGDTERLQALMAEAQQIQQQLQAAQAAVLEREEIAEMMESFQKDLRKEMTEIDPDTPKMLARMEEIARIIQGRPVMGA